MGEKLEFKGNCCRLSSDPKREELRAVKGLSPAPESPDSAIPEDFICLFEEVWWLREDILEVHEPRIWPGDHIFSADGPRDLYFHHGIYVGEDMVVHLRPASGPVQKILKKSSSDGLRKSCKKCGYNKCQGGILKTCLKCFLDGESLYLYEYGVTLAMAWINIGSCSSMNSRPADQVVKTALHQLQSQRMGVYNVLFNNCEHFAMYCKTGVPRSNHVEGAVVTTVKGAVETTADAVETTAEAVVTTVKGAVETTADAVVKTAKTCSIM